MAVSATPPPPPDLYEVCEDGEIKLNMHQGQWRAWEADERFVVVLAGTQGGKTSWGPWWLLREVEAQGQGDYLIAAPTYTILEPKILPSFLDVFDRLMGLGTFVRSPVMRFTLSEAGARRLFGDRYDPKGPPTRIFFGHARNPDSLESATYKAAWLDECGQEDFKQASFEAILRRLSLAMGRVLLTTTVYVLGWIKSVLYDPWRRGDATIKVVHFDSTENPKFPKAEWERAKASLPDWKFQMFYRGRFSRPAGVIYDCYDEERHEVEPFKIPDDWKRYIGLDFGGVNTAATFWAERPKDHKDGHRLILYREYLAGHRTAAEHKAELLRGEPAHRLPLCYGGSHSEQQWRNEFNAAGLPIAESPIVDVAVGIQRVYGVFKRAEALVFNTLDRFRSEVSTYSYKLDEAYEPIEGDIKDKETYHVLDTCRYLLSAIRPGVQTPADKPGTMIRTTGHGPTKRASIMSSALSIDADGRIVRGAATPGQLSQLARLQRRGDS
jgi:hypothetical protein